jgi:cell fate regulator YaaT (PSP1 superfamily)
MPQLIEVAFKGNRKEFYLWPGDDPPPVRTAVIVEADRGEDLGRVHAIGELAEKRRAGVPHAPAPEEPIRAVRRLATDEDLRRERELRESDEETRRRAMERVQANHLVMKLSDAEWQWDRKKLTFYFTADKRVDFRQLVRELAAMFRTRIELKQIGVRDEAKRLDGIGRCGRQYCSAAWLPELRPVNLGVAKDQRLSLNPSQISGACGRLMCSLRYEHEFYVQQRKRFPKEGKIIRTARGDEKVIANDIFRERVTLRGVDGESRAVPLADLRREVDALPMDAGSLGGETPPEAPQATPAEDDERPEGRTLRPLRPVRPHRAPTPMDPMPAVPLAVSGSPDSLESAGDDDATDVEPTSSEVAAPFDGAPAGEGERRPARRRGRRGGRRNRSASRDAGEPRDHGGATVDSADPDEPPQD